jgi:predicted DNA-binding transcriptional regulator AlpA
VSNHQPTDARLRRVTAPKRRSAPAAPTSKPNQFRGSSCLKLMDASRGTNSRLPLSESSQFGASASVDVTAPERYVTRAELAEIMGVSVPTIDRMVREGMPSETWGMRARRFRPSIALAWARARRRVAA